MKKVLFIILSSILIISLSVVPCFAASVWNRVATIRLFQNTVLSSSNISFQNAGNGYTYIRHSSAQNSDIAFIYDTYNNYALVSGQTFSIEFSVESLEYSNRFVSLVIYETNDLSNVQDGFTLGSFDIKYNDDYQCQFSYNGGQYIVCFFVMSNVNSFEISPLAVFRYNPNADMESQLDEQNSLINQQIEEQSEQFSQIYEQNSELQSQLFDDGETYSIPDIDLMEQYSIVENNPFLDGASDFESNNHIVNGVKAFATLFNLFWDGIGSDDSLSWIRYLVYLSAVVSLFLLIVGSISIRADTPSESEKYNNAYENYSRMQEVRKDYKRRHK